MKDFMTASNKLSTAVKALCFMAKLYPEAKTSTEIADEIGVNASKLRQILADLQKGGIVGSTKGINGGYFLLQDFTSLSLYEIYSALDEKKIIDLDVADASLAKDDSTQGYNEYFNHFFWKIQNQIEEQFKIIKLADIKNENSKND